MLQYFIHYQHFKEGIIQVLLQKASQLLNTQFFISLKNLEGDIGSLPQVRL